MGTCRFFREFMETQHRALTAAVDENKWYLSERARRDVGSAVAMADFHTKHLHRFAGEFREQYCSGVCPRRSSCELAERTHELNAAYTDGAARNPGPKGYDEGNGDS